MILGIDEVGRGPWAGPLVVGAVVLGGVMIEGLTDSKKLTKKRREELSFEIHERAAAIALGWVDAAELDHVGMSEALRLATRRAVEQIHAPYHEIIIDGTINFLKETALADYVTTTPKADLLVPSVSAASIIAKVARDTYMAEQDARYPGYGFRQHVGYGVAAHRQAIEQLGVCPLHRLSFAPLRKYGADRTDIRADESQKSSDIMTTRMIGDISEDAAAHELQRRGHEILEQNWRTRFCEIDIISQHGDTIYFTEVKHRKDDRAGGGIAAITPNKLRQMIFAVQLYSTNVKARDKNLRLALITTTGEPPVIESFLELE